MLTGRVEEHLLAIAAAVSWDSGDGVVGVLRTLLESAAPFEAGEVALAHPAGFQRWTLTDDESPLMGEELLMHVNVRPHPVRLDDLHESEPYERTHELLTQAGMRSLLVLPLSAAGGAEGAIGLACRHGWAFVGCSLRSLVPIAAMSGLALAQARALTALRRLSDGARAHSEPAAQHQPEPSHDHSELGRRLSQAQVELAELRAELAREREEASALLARETRLVAEREAVEHELTELRQTVAARQELLAPASEIVLGRGKYRRR